MKKWYVIIVIIIMVTILGFVFLPQIIGKIKQSGLGEREKKCSSAQLEEWVPGKGECPGETVEESAKCNEFCDRHPDCCGDRGQNDEIFGGQEKILSLPNEKEIAGLKRIYPETIKALNEGPNIYTRSLEQKVISDEKLEAIKAIGFNTIQVLLIGKKKNGQLVFNEANNAVLLNDIVAIKKHGLAVWVALDISGAPTSGQMGLGNYIDFKASFLDFTKNSAELMEKYKVEYFTANNEPDKPFKEQKTWSASEINDNLIDFFPATNAMAREEFSGKLINKITQTKKHTKEVVAASFKNVDIAGVDVGPPMDGKMSFTDYQKEFNEYQSYAEFAQQAGVLWMNAEYWQGDFENYGDFTKKNELKYAQVSFSAYLKTLPKGVGYTWNDFTTFSLPQGEETKKALADFLGKI